MGEYIGTVESCIDSEFHNIECLETEEQFGFFKDDNDIRPSQCTWVNKEVAVKLYELFAKQKSSEVKG